MKAALCVWVLGTCCLAAQAQPAPRKEAPKLPVAAASAASAAPRAEPRVTTSPAVRQSEAAQMPGELRPENRVVPQVAIPLRRERPPAPGAQASAAAASNAIDDTAARRAANRPKK